MAEVPLTPSEQLTADLCQRSFLRLWSYARVFRDQGRPTPCADGKELCDVLIVCGEDILIFSIKECAFKDTGRLDVDWPRWYDRAIRRSVKQLQGAERWLRTFPDKLFLDSRCSKAFPIPIPRGDKARIHKIIVALGAGTACNRYRADRGSMRIFPSMIGDETASPEIADTSAFTVGNLTPGQGWIHVLDDVSVRLVLRELDTITDFVNYLRKKEALIDSDGLAYAASEEDLLAVYLTHANVTSEHDFRDSDECERIAAQGGTWESFVASSGYHRKQHADAPSRLWDHIIEKFATNALAGTLVNTSCSLSEVEEGIRTMAMEHRLSRRMLANAIGGLVASAPTNVIARRSLSSMERASVGYVFLTFPEKTGGFHNRDLRRQYLSDACLVFALRDRQLRRVVGIATEADALREFRSEDLVVFDPPDVWPAALVADAEEVSEKLGILRLDRMVPRHWHDDEYRTGKHGQRNEVRAWLQRTAASQSRKPTPGV